MTPRRVGVLAAALVSDPSTAIGAAVRGWENPSTREALILMDLYDLQTPHEAPAYPRPWPDPNVIRRGRTTKTRAEVEAILAAHGHRIAKRLGGDDGD